MGTLSSTKELSGSWAKDQMPSGARKERLEVERVESWDVPKRLLMRPGPGSVVPRVLRAMSTPLVGHLAPTSFWDQRLVKGEPSFAAPIS